MRKKIISYNLAVQLKIIYEPFMLKSSIKNIWIITREYGQLAGAGGVKDVACQMASALADQNIETSVVLPLYGFINPEDHDFTPTDISFDVDLPYVQEERREHVKVWRKITKETIYLIDSPRFREKKGVYTYTADEAAALPLRRQGDGHFDYFAMNVLLQKAALDLLIFLNEKPEIVHCHDGHTALIPAMVRERDGFRQYFKNTGFVVTIHNAGIGYHQEIADLEFAQVITGLPETVITDNLLDGKFDPFLAASSYAIINTVSENYARELRETTDDELTGWLGHRLMTQNIVLEGVTNGIDPNDFDLKNPKKLGLPTGFQPGNPASGKSTGKAKCKKDLITAINKKQLVGLKQDGNIIWKTDQPLFTFIGRFTDQKGVDILVEAITALLSKDPGFQILILGSGQTEIETSLVNLADDPIFKGRICVLRGFDPIAANRIYAAGDFFVIPSKYEPCGLTDYIAQFFGNLPIVHHVGGLVKVIDGKTGFAYQDHSSKALTGAMQRAIATFRDNRKAIASMQKAAINLIYKNYTWEKVVGRYLALYKKALDF